MLNRLSVQKKILLVAAVPILAMLTLGIFAFSTQQAVRVGSDSYLEIVASKDLVADILPPPGFLVESYLTVQELANATDAAELAKLRERLATFEAEYQATHAKWDADLLVVDADIRQVFLKESFSSATQFYEVVETQFLPLLDRGDQAAALDLANSTLKDIYNTHRVSIVETVALAQAKQLDNEAQTRSLVKQRSALTIAVFVLGLSLALTASLAVARAITRSVHNLRNAANNVVATLRSTDLDKDIPVLEPVSIGSSDELAEAAAAFNAVVGTTVELLERQSLGRQALSEMFVNLGRRNQNLVSRQLRLVDELERDEADSEKLTKLFKLDHIATRMRRNAESLLVMAGLEAPRKWKRDVPVHDVLRSAVSEVEQFDRVDVLDIPAAHVSGGAAANLSHLVAELVENAVRYSPPDTPVSLSGEVLSDGVVRITIEDHGKGMTERELTESNERLAFAQGLHDAPTAYLGHFVVSHLAGRHDIKVRLHSPGGEGVRAEIDLPAAILSKVESAPTGTPAGRNTALERDGYVRTHATNNQPPVAPRPPVTVQTPVASSSAASTAGVAVETIVPAAVVAAQPTDSATVLPAQPTPAEVTAAGYKKRTPKTPSAEATTFDRFATPTQEARPRSADAVRSSLNNFSAGKTRANSGTAKANPSTPSGEDTTDSAEQGS
ncbi:MAG: ATP-binding protein [Acidimicrobiales bacterium]